jgi:hypothetical protein
MIVGTLYSLILTYLHTCTVATNMGVRRLAEVPIPELPDVLFLVFLV